MENEGHAGEWGWCCRLLSLSLSIFLSFFQKNFRKSIRGREIVGARTERETRTLPQITISLLSALSLPFIQPPSSTIYVPTLNVITTTLAYTHLTGFWKLKPEVPFVTGFNEGIRKSNDIRRLLVAMAVSWGVTGAVGVFVAWG